MYVPNYKDTEGKLALIIFDLARGEQEVKKRLVNVFIEKGTLMKDDFPKKLQDDWNYIIDFMTSKPKILMNQVIETL